MLRVRQTTVHRPSCTEVQWACGTRPLQTVAGMLVFKVTGSTGIPSWATSPVVSFNQGIEITDLSPVPGHYAKTV